MTWPTKKLGEICEIRMGETLIKKDLTSDGVPVYSANSLEEPWGFTSKNKLKFTKGAIIVGARGTLGSVKLPNDVQFTSTQTTIIINPQQEIVSSPFLSYYLRIVDFKKLRGGSGIPMLTVNRLDNLQIPLPPLPEQQKIVYVLDSIQEAVEVQDKIIEKTKELKRSLMHKLFREGTRGAKLKKTEIGEIPENWEVVKLGNKNIVEIIMGQSPPSQFYNQQKRGLPFLQGKAEFSDIWPNPNKWCSKPIKIAEKEDILISVRAPVGDVNLANQKYCIGRGLAAFRCKNNLKNIFLFNYLKFAKERIICEGAGSTFKAIKKSNLENFQIPLPPFPEQREIVEILQTVDEKIEIEQKKKELYEELFKTMLNKLMTGEIRVNNLEFSKQYANS